MSIKWNKSDLNEYRQAKKKRLKTYSKTDDILYAMCRKWPDHRNYGAVHAKVRIIGRVYATGLERKGGNDKSKGIYETVAKLLFKKRSRIDSELRTLGKFKRLSDPVCQKEILKLHGNLVGLLRNGTESGLNFRSFVSKYLHFHIPIVPIFDSRSSTTLNRSDRYSWKTFRTSARVLNMKGYDPVYYRFLMQFILYFSELEQLKQKPSVKDADYYLISSYSKARSPFRGKTTASGLGN
jgi:hypothetical protein